MTAGQQFGRKATLIVAGGADGLDLSELHFKFQITAADTESPNAAAIRIYNLSDATVKKITGKNPVEFTRVVLQAGYESAAYGVIFDGTIKQFRRGRENATDSYLDILAAENDLEYNFGVCNTTLAAGSTPQERVGAIAGGLGVSPGYVSPLTSTGGTLPRGKVLFGMARSLMRCEAATRGATWSIQSGKVNVVALDGYLPGEAVKLNTQTGLVGMPEQTEQGVKVRCLLNPKIKVGGLVQINNGDINQTSAAPGQALPAGQLMYDRRAGIQYPADVSSDGFYRVFVVEYAGDTRGQEWYCDLVCLAVDKSSDKVKANG
jgi:hypothetical protein